VLAAAVVGLGAGGGLDGTASGAEQAAKRPKRPNILFVYADDQNFKTVGCEPGSFPWVKTPHIDSIAQRGVRFAGAYLGSWCMPSRAALLTGRHPHGIESMRMEGTYPGSTYDPAKTPFWPKVFRQHGYHTCQIGKWHTGTDAGTGRDWDRQIVWNRPKHPEDAGRYYGPQILSFDGEEKVVEGYTTDNYTQWACDYIRGDHRDPDKPWYLWLCYGAIHGPSIPAARHKGTYAKEPVPVPADIFPPRPGKPKYLEHIQAWSKGKDGVPVMASSGEKFGDDSAQNARTHAQFVRQMNECVPAIDEGVGKVLAALRETGQDRDTLVVYSADQGFSMGEHGFRTKIAPYDANYRSVFLASLPGTIPEGKVCPQAVNAPDVVVTFFSLAGIERPWKMHGRDLTPYLRAPETEPIRPVLYEHCGHDYGSDVSRQIKAGKPGVHSNVPWYAALRSGKHKYVRTFVAGEVEEIYDLETDPEELKNLATDPTNGRLLYSLRQLCLAELLAAEADYVDDLPPTAAMGK
jgi:arylsulfatase A-like enzyme